MLGRIVASAACCTLSPSDNQTGVETQPILLLTFYEQHMIVTQQGCNISTEMLYHQINKNLIVCRAVNNIHSTSCQAHTHTHILAIDKKGAITYVKCELILQYIFLFIDNMSQVAYL